MKHIVLIRRMIGLWLALAVVLTACGAPAAKGPVTLRVGYFPNITHSQALIGVARGDFAKALGSNATLDVKIFNAGPSVIEAMFASQLDLSYIGPNPAINGYVKSNGQALRVIAGATSGGAALVVRSDSNITRPEDLAGKKLASPQLGNTQDVALVVRSDSNITRPEDLAGKKIASPQLGNTQDVALRTFLISHGLKLVEKGGDVQVIPTDNPQILDLFRQKQIDGAWVPEPWATRLIVEGGGKLFLDERDLWPATHGDFVTANIIVSTQFLKEHPDLVKAWLGAHVEVTQWELANPDQAKQIANDEIKRLTGKALPDQVIDGAWSRMRITYDPISDSLIKSADAAYTAGFLKDKPNLSGIYDLKLLNETLREKGLPPVK